MVDQENLIDLNSADIETLVSLPGIGPAMVERIIAARPFDTPKDLEKVFSDRTKVVLLNSPNNPTGAVYSRNELFAIAEYLEDKDVVIIADEIYEKIVYDGNVHVSIAAYSDKIKNKTVIVNGVSKAFSMTGWRIGYAAGPAEIIGAVNKLQGHTSGNPTSISQWASVTALVELPCLRRETVNGE